MPKEPELTRAVLLYGCPKGKDSIKSSGLWPCLIESLGLHPRLKRVHEVTSDFLLPSGFASIEDIEERGETLFVCSFGSLGLGSAP